MGYAVSLLYISAVFIASFLLHKSTKNNELSRKLIHIMLGGWPFIAFAYFTNIYTIISIPVLFILINYVSVKNNLIDFMERDDNSFGTVWYAVSLTVLVCIGFLSGKEYLAYIPVLSLAIGDGFAAIIGTKFGKQKFGFLLETKKSYVGSGIVFFSIVVISTIILHRYGVSNILVTAFIVAFVGTFNEAFSSNGYDNFVLPLGIGVTLGIFDIFPSHRIATVVIFTTILLAYAYYKKALTLNAVSTALLVALLLLLLGGAPSYLGLIVFFISASLAGKFTNKVKKQAESLHMSSGTRGVKQVLMNTLPALYILIIGWLLNREMTFFRIASLIAFSVATADTFASEIGMLSEKKIFSVLTFKEIKPGLSGGVSILGLGASFVGALMIAVIGMFYYSYKSAIIILSMGFLGALLDSVLGELLQAKYTNLSGVVTEKEQENGVKLKLTKRIPFIDNNIVNIPSSSLMLLFQGLVAYLRAG